MDKDKYRLKSELSAHEAFELNDDFNFDLLGNSDAYAVVVLSEKEFKLLKLGKK